MLGLLAPALGASLLHPCKAPRPPATAHRHPVFDAGWWGASLGNGKPVCTVRQFGNAGVGRTENFSGKVSPYRMVRQRVSMNHDIDHYSVGGRGELPGRWRSV